VLAWLVATGVMLVACAVDGWPPFAPATWKRFDSYLYMRVAQSGYVVHACRGQLPGPPECGNAGWFPGYPWLTGGLSRLGLPLDATALAIAWLAGLATLIVLWRAFLADWPRPNAVIALVYAAFAPGVVYNYGLFPLSLLSLATVSYLALMQRRQWLAAGFAAAVAALAYPVGLTVAPAGVLWLLAQRGVPWLDRLRRAVAAAAPAAAAVAAFVLVQLVQTRYWDAYLLVQRKYGHQLEDPFTAVGTAIATVRHAPFQLDSAPSWQLLLLAFTLLCVLVELVLRWRSRARADALVATWAVLAWLLLYVETQVHTYRGEAALLPLAILVRRLPWPLAAAITAAAVAIAVPMLRLYLVGILV
jgi:hypothetical protein